jgi:hypothetical protein
MTLALHRASSPLLTLLGLTGALALGGCPGDDGGDGDMGGDDGIESEIITTVRLTFTPVGGGTPVVAAFTDPDGDGGVSGSADPITLVDGETYALAIEFLDELQEPAVDITAEVEDEAEEHQVFIHGNAVVGPATFVSLGGIVEHAYADIESTYGPNATGEDLPVGLANIITTLKAGTPDFDYDFWVTLRHMPELNGQPQKTADLADALRRSEPLPGDVDAFVQFQIVVQ